MVVDAKAASVGFYQRKGFVRLGPDGQDNGLTVMFVDLLRLQIQ